jgi:putative DNA primase/helicase
VPEEVQRKLTQVGKRFYFPDGEEAFLDRGRRLTTHSENAVLVRFLIRIAQAREWRGVEVRGSRQFRQRAWRLGMQAGLEVEGYRPTRLERAKLAQQHSDLGRKSPEPAQAAEAATTRSRLGSAPQTRVAARPQLRAEEELVVGRLVAHGPENYQFRADGAMSYYVKLQTDRGVRVLWGKDLPRAVSA